jgi:hypothetical protein
MADRTHLFSENSSPASSPFFSDLIDACLAVHRQFGPGGGSRVGHIEILIQELNQKGISTRAHHFLSHCLLGGEEFDLVVEDHLAVKLADVSDPELLIRSLESRLSQNGIPIGLIVDFNQVDLSNGLWLVNAPAGGNNRPRQTPLLGGVN